MIIGQNITGNVDLNNFINLVGINGPSSFTFSPY